MPEIRAEAAPRDGATVAPQPRAPVTAGSRRALKLLVGSQQAATAEFHPRGSDPKRYVKTWHEEDSFGGRATSARVIILRTRGCDWLIRSGCTMCGYFSDSHLDQISAEDIIHQFESAMATHEGEELVKIYTSGSFYDTREVPLEARRHILTRVGEATGKFSAESVPEILTPEVAEEAVSLAGEVEVGIGLESSSDHVLVSSVNKGFRFHQYVAGARAWREAGGRVKTYTLLKPPFLTEREALADTIRTVRDVAPHTDVVSVNPVNIQSHTLVAKLFRAGQFRPPWLWSAAKAVLEAHSHLPDHVTLKCHPVGGGTPRGAHNCRECDPRFLKALEAYTLRRDTMPLERLFADPCTCQAIWELALAREGLALGGAARWG